MPEYTPKSGIQRWAIQEAIGVDRRNPETLEWETALGVKPFGPIGYREAPRITFGTGAGGTNVFLAGDTSGLIYAQSGLSTRRLISTRTGSIAIQDAGSSPDFAPFFGLGGEGVTTGYGIPKNSTAITTYASSVPTVSATTGGSLPTGSWSGLIIYFVETEWGKTAIADRGFSVNLTTGNQTIRISNDGTPSGAVAELYLRPPLSASGFCYRYGSISTETTGSVDITSPSGMPTGYVWFIRVNQLTPTDYAIRSVTNNFAPHGSRVFYLGGRSSPTPGLPILALLRWGPSYNFGDGDVLWSDVGYTNHVFSPTSVFPNKLDIATSYGKAIIGQSNGIEVFTDTSSYLITGDFATTSGTRVTQRPTFVGSDGSACVSTGRTWSVWKGSIWNVDSGEEIENQPVGVTFVSVAFDPRFNSLVALTSTGYAYGYDIPTGRWYYLDDNGTRTSVRDYAFQTPQGVYLAESGTNGSLYSLTVEPQGTQKLSWRELSFGYPVDQKQLHRILLSFDYSERTIPNDTTFPISNVVLRRMEDMSTNIPTTIQRLSRNWYEIVPDTSAIGRQFYLSMDVNYSRCKTVFCPIIFEFTPLEAAR